jgi:hypothetical protein
MLPEEPYSVLTGTEFSDEAALANLPDNSIIRAVLPL